MALITQSPKGTQDIMPKEAAKWQIIEEVMRSEADSYGFGEVRTPVFEHTELFLRGVGDTSDIVEKQMYTFDDKGGRSITLKPEGTAGAVRAMLQSGEYNNGYPLKYYYFSQCYRYEKPQAGRFREHHQFGCEMFGTSEAIADAQLILFGKSLLERLGVKDLSLEINSIGCPICRKNYNEALKTYLNTKKEELCETCLSRIDRNPMRILDCKSPVCSKIGESAPVIIDYLCDECNTHFNSVKGFLTELDVEFTINPKIVRGLDYYTKTVFEFLSDSIGAKSAVCAGGRYDGLVEQLGGKPTAGLGFGMGIERLLLVMQSQNIEFPEIDTTEIYVASMGDNAVLAAFKLTQELRDCGISAECDLCKRGLKAQMKYADKIGAKYSIVLGDNELENQRAELKNMNTGAKAEISLGDNFLKEYIAVASDEMTLASFIEE